MPMNVYAVYKVIQNSLTKLLYASKFIISIMMIVNFSQASFCFTCSTPIMYVSEKWFN